MSNLTINDYLKYADLQMAAEAFLRDENSLELADTPEKLEEKLINGNNHSSKFTETQAQAFVTQWEVLDQQTNTSTGFSGTLFRNKANPQELVLSLRSTEFIDDAVRDSAATNELEIKNTGFAWGQIADMEAWYESLYANGHLNAGSRFSVTGYSLGGHLATTFHLLRDQDGTRAAKINEQCTIH